MTHGGVEVQLYTFLLSAFGGGKRSSSRSGRFTPREESLVPSG